MSCGQISISRNLGISIFFEKCWSKNQFFTKIEFPIFEVGWVGDHIFKDTRAISIKIGGQEGVGDLISNPEYKSDRSSINR